MMYNLSKEEVIEILKTSPTDGLSEKEAKRRQREYGKNTIGESKRRGVVEIFISQLKNALLILLIISAGISYYIGEVLDATAIILAVIISMLSGTFLEYKADKSLEELKKFMGIKAIVIRDGKVKEIDAKDVVPGDVIVVNEGMVIPADAYIIESNDLEVDESPLTGESTPVIKAVGIVAEDTPLAERTNIIYGGTRVARGQAKAIVFAIGEKTEFGKIAKSVTSTESSQTPLEKRVNELGKKVTLLSIIIIVVFFVIGLLQGRDVNSLFIFSVALAVAAIPEGLTTVMTIILALGVKEMAKHNAIVRKISAVDTLGSVDFIVTDKTGTITEGKLSVTGSITFDISEEELIKKAVLCSLSHKSETGNIIGDDIETAIYKKAEEMGINPEKERETAGIKEIIPFNPKTKIMEVTVNRKTVIKGAPEVILEMANYIGKKKITNTKRKDIIEHINKLAGDGFRIIGVCEKSKSKTTLLGFILFSDKERPEAKQTIEQARKAGISILMITGDSLPTAKTIARRVGLLNEKNSAVEWKDIESLHDEEIFDRIRSGLTVIARATPESKLRIVEILSNHNHVVAVTGDGINDAPALKRAHIGVVMGQRGTDVSKQVADLVLVDDNLSTLIEAIKFGRNIFFNITNFIRFQFTTNASALLITLFSFISKLPFPLTPVQILWINIIMDGPPALAQAFEKPTKNIMEIGPIKKESFLAGNIMYTILLSAIYISLITFGIFTSNIENAATMAFNVFVLFQLFNALNCRSLKSHFWEGLMSNKQLILTILIMLIIQISLAYIPEVREVFSIKPMVLSEWLLAIGIAFSVVVFDEIRKTLKIWVESI